MHTDTQVDSELIRRLREKTGAGMMDCKKALVEGKGDFEKAVEHLRKKGLSDAAKRSARITKEGLIGSYISPCGKKGAVVELNCETDFVAKTEEFRELASALAEAAGEGRLPGPESAGPIIAPMQAKLGENMGLRRFDRFELKGPGLLAAYVHTQGGKKGAMIELSCGSDALAAHEAVAALARELALQTVAMSPKWVKRSDVPQAVVEKEKEIFAEVTRKDGKPEAAVGKIVEGKLNKLFFGAFCLLEQPSMRDPKIVMSSLVDDAAKKAGGKVEVRRFARYQLGGE
ncbi:MAG: translation elongation factor Ts [Elusimicrobia bacterium]|nr:translation elongation factor Ts [Elusimicrobiota bacterium]